MTLNPRSRPRARFQFRYLHVYEGFSWSLEFLGWPKKRQKNPSHIRQLGPRDGQKVANFRANAGARWIFCADPKCLLIFGVAQLFTPYSRAWRFLEQFSNVLSFLESRNFSLPIVVVGVFSRAQKSSPGAATIRVVSFFDARKRSKSCQKRA